MTTNNGANIINVSSPTTLLGNKIATYTASSSASLVIPVGATYTQYLLAIDSLVEGTTNAKLYLTFSTDGGSTYLNSYGEVYVQTAQDGGPVRGGANSQAQITLTEDVGIDSSDGGYGYYGQIVLYNKTGTQPRVQFNSTWKGSSPATLRFINGSAYAPGDSNPVTALKFAMSSGNIASGTITVYGYN